jgi:hypothetical protein
MKYLRRVDLDLWTRLEMVLAMRAGDWGVVSDLARKHQTSRQFVYDVKEWAEGILAKGTCGDGGLSGAFASRLILSMRLHCGASLDGISKTLRELGLGPSSVGHVSEFLREAAKSCPSEVFAKCVAVPLMVDETFSNNRPILVIMEGRSHHIMAIELASDRKSETWQAMLKKLQAAGVDIGMLVKDQGSSLKAAARALGLAELADLFHLNKPFDHFLGHFERRAYGAIAWEGKRLVVLGNRRSDGSFDKASAAYEAAKKETASAIRLYDDFHCVHGWIHEAFDSFTADGRPRSRAMAEADVMAAMDLLEEAFPFDKKMSKAIGFLRKNSADHWSYFDELHAIVALHFKELPAHMLRAACLAWQLARKSVAVKDSGLKKELLAQSKIQMGIAVNGGAGRLKDAVDSLLDDLDSNLRSSSPLEAINSTIRRYLDSCRGQTTQEALDMLAYFMNHRKATRGKYRGTSPYERLFGVPEEGTPIDMILKNMGRSMAAEPPGGAPMSTLPDLQKTG